jgi:hypothetical protein
MAVLWITASKVVAGEFTDRAAGMLVFDEVTGC